MTDKEFYAVFANIAYGKAMECLDRAEKQAKEARRLLDTYKLYMEKAESYDDRD